MDARFRFCWREMRENLCDCLEEFVFWSWIQPNVGKVCVCGVKSCFLVLLVHGSLSCRCVWLIERVSVVCKYIVVRSSTDKVIESLESIRLHWLFDWLYFVLFSLSLSLDRLSSALYCQVRGLRNWQRNVHHMPDMWKLAGCWKMGRIELWDSVWVKFIIVMSRPFFTQEVLSLVHSAVNH